MSTTGAEPGFLKDLVGEGVDPEGIDDARYRYSKWTLAFKRPRLEAAYVTYRTPIVLRFLRWLLAAGALMVFAGSMIDFSRLDSDQAWLLTGLRMLAATGMVLALCLTWTVWVRDNLQTFIAIGATLVHVIWLLTVPIVEERIAEYTGVLPINIMLTFLVSGLMFRWARFVALGAALAYAAALVWQHPGPLAPIFYLVLSALYAGFAAYVAERARREAWAEAQALEAERENSERLLLNVLPPSIAGRMKLGEELIADRFDDSAVLFADIVGFTEMSSEMEPEALVEILDEIFRRFDIIVEDLDLEKIKTIGDCYMVACGLPAERALDAIRLAEAALAMQRELQHVADSRDKELAVRVGIHCGPVVAGVIGRSKFIYDLWGDTVNMASRMESSAPSGAIQVSDAMRQRLEHDFDLEFRGEVELKGKGLQPAWILKGRKA